MERNLLKFENKTLGAEIRVVHMHGEPWFVAKDVAEALGYEWNGKSRIAHIPDEWRGVTSVVTPSGTQEMLCISEQGLYFFLGRSDKAVALPFQKWIAGEVLPSIRKHGVYMTPSAVDDLLANPESIYVLAKALCDERERREVAEEKLDMVRPRLPFGTVSRFNGKPRTKLVPSFWRSTTTTTTITEIAEYQRSLFDE